MWVMGQLCDGSHGSWVTKDDPFPSLKGVARLQFKRRQSGHERRRRVSRGADAERGVVRGGVSPSAGDRSREGTRPPLQNFFYLTSKWRIGALFKLDLTGKTRKQLQEDCLLLPHILATPMHMTEDATTLCVTDD